MKWGVRRYQNKDGSLTNAGRKRYMDNPSVQNSKKEYETALTNLRTAQATYNNASNKATLLPTSKNRSASKQALQEYNDAKIAYDSAKFKYKTDKEVSRIADKGISFNKKSKHRLKLEEQYRKMGLSEEQAQAAANNRIRTEKILATSAALTVGACAAYYAHNKYKNKIDGVIKAGQSLQRIEMQDTGGKLHDMFYAASGKHDTRRYANLLGAARQRQTGHAYMMKLEAMKDIKVASKDNAAKVFGELYKNDSEFRTLAKDYISEYFNGSNKVRDLDDLSTRNIRKMYENLNGNLIYSRDSSVNKKFFNALKAKGYGAIQDINDMKFSGYHAKNPLIVFDNSNDNVLVKSMSEITEDLSKSGTKELLKATAEQMTEEYIRTYGTLTAAGLTTATGAVYTSKPKKYDYRKKRSR